MRFTVGSGSDVGQLRSLNEDSLLVSDNLFAVADGMGGHRGGEVASARALEAFNSAAEERTLDALMTAVQAANRDVFEHARSTPELAGMGTTLCGLAGLDDHRVAIVNVGDSRVYLLRNEALFQVSEDHSFVETLVREGRLTRAQADVHPQRNVITRALGIEPHIDVDGWEVVVADGDRFLLCSDGLFNEVADADIESTLREVADPVEAAGRLIDAANAGGGRDNVTCVVVDISDVAPGADADLTEVGRPVTDSLTRRSSAADLDATTVDQPNLAGAVGAAPADTTIPAAATPPTRRPRRLTWRTVVFLLAIVATFAAALVATDWYYKNTYSVGARDGKVVIFRGPPGTDVLWFSAKVLPTDVAVSKLSDADQQQVRNGIDGLSLSEANGVVAKLEDQVAAAATTTSTTTTTTTTTTTVAVETTVAGGP